MTNSGGWGRRQTIADPGAFAVKKLLRRLRQDHGLSLIEVMAAMIILGILAVSVAYALTSMLQMTRDSQARETAVNLASAELDAVRAIGDPFAVVDASRTQTVGTNTYTIVRKTGWVDADGLVDTCGTGGSSLRYKNVSVQVSWNGMREGASPVYTDTAVVPGERINDPSKGTILVSVKDSQGLGYAGVTFTAKSSSVTLTTTPTNADGCSYLLAVPPGDYTVTLTKSNHKGIDQESFPKIVRTVEAGTAARYLFQYDEQGSYDFRYASNESSPLPKLPANLQATFFNTTGQHTLDVSADNNLLSTAKLYPAPTGYEVVAGTYVPYTEEGQSCEAVDPASWAPDETQTPPVEGIRATTAYADPGGSTATRIEVPMGVLTVSGLWGTNYLHAVSSSTTLINGQPACDVNMTYYYTGLNSTQKIALPFGTWQLYTSSSKNGTKFAVSASRISLITPGQLESSGRFALDPRGVTP